jgi:hypothetical protein
MNLEEANITITEREAASILSALDLTIPKWEQTGNRMMLETSFVHAGDSILGSAADLRNFRDKLEILFPDLFVEDFDYEVDENEEDQ